MTYSLGSASEPNATWGAYYNDMGELQEERPPKVADLTPEPLYASDSDDTPVFDYGGCIRRVVIKFKKVDSFTNLATFLQALMTLINGDQTPPHYPVTFVSDALGTLKVKIERIDPILTVSEGPCILEYKLHLIESSDIG